MAEAAPDNKIISHAVAEAEAKLCALPSDGDDEVCEACGGAGEIDQRLGGEWNSGVVPCPDCRDYLED